MSHKYQDLIAFQKAKLLAVEVYRATDCFPKSEIYGLTSQSRRAAVSVVSNIAEGQGRLTKGEFLHFLGRRGSLLELETQFVIASELQFVSGVDCDRIEALTSEVRRLLNGLIDSLRPTK